MMHCYSLVSAEAKRKAIWSLDAVSGRGHILGTAIQVESELTRYLVDNIGS
jgi:hypothetical protein